VVDLSSHQVLIDAFEVSLSPTEFAILERLIRADTAVLDYENLLGDEEGQVLDARDAALLLRYHIRNLRQKFREAGGDPDLIVHVRNVGYRIATRAVRTTGDNPPVSCAEWTPNEIASSLAAGIPRYG
jgi:DNA-binding response OmpR family regulator